MCRGLSNNTCLLNMLKNSQQDAVLAAEASVDGILLSNHGGVCTTHTSTQVYVTSMVFRRSAIKLVRMEFFS